MTVLALSNTGNLQGTFSTDLYQRWTNYIDTNSAKTLQTYSKAIKQFALYLNECGIKQPQREDVINYRESLKQTHKPTTVQNYIMAVKQFFNWTETEGLYPNIAKHIKGMKLDNEHKKSYLTIEQIQSLLKAIDRTTEQGKRDYAIISLMVTTGLRTISIADADIKDLRPAGNDMALYYKGKGHTEKAVYVKVAEPVERAIRDYLKARQPKYDTEPLFTSVSNKNQSGRMTTRSISRIAKESFKAIGIDREDVTAHSLRHTAGTQALLTGAKLEEVQQMLDHRNIQTTLIYAHNLERANNNTELKIAQEIFN